MVARDRNKGVTLAILKRREARLNRAILQVLTKKSPKTRYEIYKQIKGSGLQTRYSNINYRIKALDASGFIRKCGSRKTKSGFTTDLYESTPKGYLALALAAVDFDKLILAANEAAVLTLLSLIVEYVY
jgi:hypothetical protein